MLPAVAVAVSGIEPELAADAAGAATEGLRLLQGALAHVILLRRRLLLHRHGLGVGLRQWVGRWRRRDLERSHLGSEGGGCGEILEGSIWG